MAGRTRPRIQPWQRWLGAAALAVSVVSAVVLFTVRKEGPVYRAEPPADVEAGGRITVEILNGCGAGGAARRASELLRGAGFDVVRVDNAHDFGYTETVVVDRSGAYAKALRVAGSMGCEHIVRQVAPDALVDVSVILGRDGLWSRGPEARRTPVE
jgi:hypothetical protein